LQVRRIPPIPRPRWLHPVQEKDEATAEAASQEEAAEEAEAEEEEKVSTEESSEKAEAATGVQDV